MSIFIETLLGALVICASLLTLCGVSIGAGHLAIKLGAPFPSKGLPSSDPSQWGNWILDRSIVGGISLVMLLITSLVLAIAHDIGVGLMQWL